MLKALEGYKEILKFFELVLVTTTAKGAFKVRWKLYSSRSIAITKAY
jgi:hypothetical protein